MGEVISKAEKSIFRFGSIDGKAKAEKIENSTMTPQNIVEIVFRYDKEITEDCNLKINGKTFEVVSVIDKTMTCCWLTVTAMEVSL